MKRFFLNFTFTFGYSAGHVRRNFGQDWVCQHAALTPQRHCFLWPEPGRISVNGKSPIGSMAGLSVINPKLALMDDDIMAGQRRPTNFRAVDNTYQGCHMPWVAFTGGCRDENTYGGSSCICMYLLVFYSYPLLNYMFYDLLSVDNILSWQVKYAHISLALPTLTREVNHRSLPNSCGITTVFRDLANMFTSSFLILLGTMSLMVSVCISL